MVVRRRYFSSQRRVFFRSTVVSPSSQYAYDALYRMTSASGREYVDQTGGRPRTPAAPTSADDTLSAAGDAATNSQAMARYEETYAYTCAAIFCRWRTR
jgi:hypothetical protein